MWSILLLSFVIRIGEAKNPGPGCHNGLVLGAINPTGLTSKSCTLMELPRAHHEIWGVSESHLTCPGVRKFQRELRFRKIGLNYHPGAPAPFRSNSFSATGGKQLGTGFLTTMPSRALQPSWTPEQWKQARFSINTFCCDNVWIHGAVAYGYASGVDNMSTKQATEALLQIVTERVVMQMKGRRFIVGDFNHTPGQLEQIDVWRKWGWREAQEIMQEKFGVKPQPTCKGKTLKDYVWLSPELVTSFDRVEILPHLYPDHAVVAAFFKPFGEGEKVHLWRKPKPFQWSEIKQMMPDHQWKSPQDASTFQKSVIIAQNFEERLERLCSETGKRLHPSQKGRGQTLQPKSMVAETRPLPKGRHGQIEPAFAGVSHMHVRWFSQLRRIESLCQHLHKPEPTNSAVLHMQREWRAICRAKGFVNVETKQIQLDNEYPQGNEVYKDLTFVKWWQTVPSKQESAPIHLPQELPSMSEMKGILITFAKEVRVLENVLRHNTIVVAKRNRINNPNKVFQDVQKPPVAPITMLDDSKVATVIEVDPTECSVTLDNETKFSEDHPIACPSGILQPIFITDDKIWLEEEQMIPIGTKIRQDRMVAELDNLFQKFSDEWTARWDRHISVADDHWDPINEFFETSMPPCPEIELPTITPEVWIASLKAKKSHAATGPDGWSRADLISMPYDLVIELLDILHRVEKGENWPRTWVTGFVFSLEKLPSASKVQHFRPITVFSIIYRNWGSIRAKQCLKHLSLIAPQYCYGNLPHRSANQLWYTMQCYIERSYEDQSSMAGCLVDIVKAFNHLPRLPILRAAKHLGLPAPVIRAWASALTTLERRFVIRGSVGPPLKSSTGLAEGCAMSVVGMAVINIMVNEWMKHKQPETRVWSFVDNWELTATNAMQVADSYQDLQKITDLLDLQLDPNKTVIWATGPSCRKWLREQGHDVAMWAKDLGAHIQFSRQVTNNTIVSKIEKFLERWGDFARSPATYSQKIKAIKAVCWPNTLHGISSAHLGRDHYDSLRTAAMRSLRETSWGASPIMHLSLVEEPLLDPCFFALMTTVMDCRNHMTFDDASIILDSVTQNPRIKPLPGPCNVLLHRLQAINWHWEVGVGFRDEWGRIVDIWDRPVQEVKGRLTESWQHHVACEISKRHSFSGMQFTSAYLTRAFDKPPPCKEAILRRALNGTFYTADKLQHGEFNTMQDKCIFCGQQDSFRHRNWECPVLEPAREVCTPEDKIDILSHRPSFYNHGWVPTPPTLQDFRNKLEQVPDQRFEYNEPEHLPECLEIFTDGGALCPKNALCRWASWGAVVAVTDQSTEFQAISSGLVQGTLQTVSRAELTAAISAVYFAASRGRKFRLWVDNQYVVKACRKCIQQRHKWVGRKTPNHDLLQELHNAFQYGSNLCMGIIKVASHQKTATDDDAITRWVFRGNEAADHLAASVFSQHPDLLATWTTLSIETDRLLHLRRIVHTVLISVGEAAIELTKTQRDITNSTKISVDLQNDNMEFQDWRLVQFLPQTAKSFEVDEWALIHRWIGTFHNTGTVQRWSWYQLYMDFLLDHKQGGPWYAGSKKRWVSARERPSTDFAQQSRSFAKYLTKLARKLGTPLPTVVSRPDSYTIFFWCTTLPVKTTEARRARVDEALAMSRATYRQPMDMTDVMPLGG